MKIKVYSTLYSVHTNNDTFTKTVYVHPPCHKHPPTPTTQLNSCLVSLEVKQASVWRCNLPMGSAALRCFLLFVTLVLGDAENVSRNLRTQNRLSRRILQASAFTDLRVLKTSNNQTTLIGVTTNAVRSGEEPSFVVWLVGCKNKCHVSCATHAHLGKCAIYRRGTIPSTGEVLAGQGPGIVSFLECG